jgi:NADH-quinone oxidoreductase subunit K
MIPVLHNYLIVGAVLFTLGAVGFVTRRNLFLMVLSVEMMLQGVSVNLVAFGRYWGDMSGQSFTVFVLTVAACEAAIALSLVLALYQRRATLDVGAWRDLAEPSTEPAGLVDEPVGAEPMESGLHGTLIAAEGARHG